MPSYIAWCPKAVLIRSDESCVYKKVNHPAEVREMLALRASLRVRLALEKAMKNMRLGKDGERRR
ncbi:hypothetical protein BTZ53_10780 [Vibrio parahaemolyticus]|nr:hypothetical protein BTZ53_10780 [Vibrio parahaemolyticus]